MTSNTPGHSISHGLQKVGLAWGIFFGANLLGGCNGQEPPPLAIPDGEADVDPFVIEVVDLHAAAARQDPGNAELRATLGLVYEANEMWFLARRAFENAELLDPDKPEWSLHVAIALYQLGESEPADARIVELVRRYPDFMPARFRLGVLKFERGELESALSEFTLCARHGAGYAENHVAVAETLVALDRFDEALPKVEKAVAMAPDYKRALYVRGLVLRGLGRTADAQRDLTLGTDAERSFLPDDAAQRLPQYFAGLAVLLGKAVNLIDSGRPAEAVGMLEKARAKRPDDIGILNNLAIAYRGLKDPASAAKHLTHAHALDPSNFPTLINLAGCYWETRQFKESLAAADKALVLVPKNGQALFSRAQALMGLERFEEARVDLEQSLRFDKSNIAVFGSLAEVYMRLERWDQAEEAWEAVIQRAPDNLPARYNLCLSQVRQSKLDGARVNLEKMKMMAPTHQATQAAEQLIERAGQ